mmetsp:Transcript_12059/g.31548  ORF Transcript_12059/g.31548 Transcript_12059/m.31548 type:complete len:149 (+) Transcript_12059:60-506(+)
MLLGEEAEARIRLPPGRIVHIEEITGDPAALANCQVRVLGRLKAVNCALAEVVLEHNNHELVVDTGHLSTEQHPALIGHLYTVIGEVDPAAPEHAADLVVRARVSRCVDGMDTALFERALEIKRMHDARIEALFSSPNGSDGVGCPAA